MRTSLRAALSAALVVAAAASPTLLAETPKDPKSPLPGHVDGRGPTGPVELKIVAPKADEVIPMPTAQPGQPEPKGADVAVRLEIKNYEIFQDAASKTGQHIHIILDNQPYVAHYDATKAWVFKNVPKGTHAIRAFPSRPWHESIKEASAFATVTFHVGEKDGKNTAVAGAPLLTYSRPKGKYPKSQAAKVMLDFFVTGCALGAETDPNACQVTYKLDDKPEAKLTAWEPVWWDGLSVGKHAYVIGLMRGGKVVENATFNLVKAGFEIEEDAPPATPGAGPGLPAEVKRPEHNH